MGKSLSRREFLQKMAVGLSVTAGGVWLAGCTQPAGPASPTAPATSMGVSPTATIRPAAGTTPESAATVAGAVPDLVVVRGGEPEALVNRALAALGGMEAFVPKGARVIIKPNICTAYHSYEYATTTNPWVVGALVKLCLAAGAGEVRVMDSPFGGSPEEAYAVSGIQEQVEAAGGIMEVMSDLKFLETEIPEGKSIKRWDVYEDALKADVLINVPIAKHHSLAGLTLGMKNLMGLIKNREGIHISMGPRLADLTSLFRPTLTVIDAVRILTANGPTGGNLKDVKQLDTVIVSPDIVAADAYAATLFGYKPDDLRYILHGAERGLGRSDLSQLKIEEIAL